MSSTVPPLVTADFILSAFFVPLPLRFVARMCLIPPEVSLPSVSNPAPLRARQFLMTTYSVGRFTRRPSQSLPDLIQKLSSLQSISQFSTNTHDEESISTPSVLGPWPPTLFCISNPSTLT